MKIDQLFMQLETHAIFTPHPVLADMQRLLLLLGMHASHSWHVKKQQQPQPAKDYVPGMLLICVKANASMESVFTLTNNRRVSILSIYGYVYRSPWPKDSIASLTTFLDTKKYLDTFQWKASAIYTVQGYTAVYGVYQYMDTAAQNDWINTKQQLQLTEVIPATDTMKYLWIKVPDGQEQALMDTIKRDPIVTAVALNHISQMRLY